MATRRQTTASLDKLYAHFIQHGVTKPITYDEYLSLGTSGPMTRRELAQIFNGRWARVLTALIRRHPLVYDQASLAHTPAETPAKPAPKKAPAKPAPTKRFTASKKVEKDDE